MRIAYRLPKSPVVPKLPRLENRNLTTDHTDRKRIRKKATAEGGGATREVTGTTIRKIEALAHSYKGQVADSIQGTKAF